MEATTRGSIKCSTFSRVRCIDERVQVTHYHSTVVHTPCCTSPVQLVETLALTTAKPS